MRFCGPAALAAGLLFATFAAPASAGGAIEVQAKPIESFLSSQPEQTRFGRLTFRGGLVLSSRDGDFGGWSGLWLDPAGEKLIAVSDRGSWLTGRLTYANGRPTGLTDAIIAPVLGEGGQPVDKTKQDDVESLAISDGMAVIGIERRHDILRFRFEGDPVKALPAAHGSMVAFPDSIRDALKSSSNESFEGLTLVPGPLGTDILVLSELNLDEAGNFRGWLIAPDGRANGFTVARGPGDFSITDVAQLSPDQLVISERHYSLTQGVKLRLRRIARADIRPGALVDGEVLLEANLRHQIDNMEGIAVHRTAAGETVLTLLSDDNFNPLQRTLLLQFTLEGPPAP